MYHQSQSTESTYHIRMGNKKNATKKKKATKQEEASSGQKQCLILMIYLRGYYSQCVLQYPKNRASFYRYRTNDLRNLLAYWVFVETGAPHANNCPFNSSSDHAEYPWHWSTPIAIQLSWARARLELDSDDTISEEGELRKDGLSCSHGYSTSIFQGCVEVKDVQHWDIPNCKETFHHLQHIKSLRIYSCSEVTDDAFRPFDNLLSFEMVECRSITDQAFSYLTNLQSLCMKKSYHVTDDAFRHLPNLKSLHMLQCNQRTLTNEAFRHLTNLQSLSIPEYNGGTITVDIFRHLTNLSSLNVERDRDVMKDHAFCHLYNLRSLNIRACCRSTITDKAFHHLIHLQSLIMNRCNQTTITDEAFLTLTNLQKFGHARLQSNNHYGQSFSSFIKFAVFVHGMV